MQVILHTFFASKPALTSGAATRHLPWLRGGVWTAAGGRSAQRLEGERHPDAGGRLKQVLPPARGCLPPSGLRAVPPPAAGQTPPLSQEIWPGMAAHSLLGAIDLGPGDTELYANTHASTRRDHISLKIKAACGAAVSTVLGPHASVQAAGSRAKGTAIMLSDYDLYVRRTPPIDSIEVSRAQAHAVGAAAVHELRIRGLGTYTYKLGKVG